MKLERAANTKRNIIVGEADKFIGILLPFIVRTMIIHFMAAEYLGLMGLFYSIVQMLNLAELGFGTAIVYSMYKPIAENDVAKINALLRFYARVYFVVGIIVAAVGLGIMFFLPQLITGDVPENINIYLLYLIFLGNTCINFFVFPNKKALMTAYQRDDLIGKMHIITQLCMYALQMVSVYMARDFYLYALTIPVSSFAFNVLCARQTKKYYPQYHEEGELSGEEYREIKKQVAGLMVRKVATLSRNAFDSMFISAFLGLEITAVYGNYYYVMDAVVIILAVVKTSMAGGVGNSIAMETVDKNLRDMKTINFLYMCLSTWCAVCLLCLYQPFMKLWVGEDMMFPAGIAVIFSVYFYVLKTADIRTLYSEAVGVWWQARYLSVAEAVSNLLMNYLFIRYMGVYGIILATLISYLIFNFIGGAVILFRYYFVCGGFLDYIVSNLRYAAVAGVVGALSYMVVSRISISGWGGLIIKGVVCAVLAFGLLLLIYCRTKDFKEGMTYIRKILKKNGTA
jgi:O-antigen/teichoic acid export membrane protein